MRRNIYKSAHSLENHDLGTHDDQVNLEQITSIPSCISSLQQLVQDRIILYCRSNRRLSSKPEWHCCRCLIGVRLGAISQSPFLVIYLPSVRQSQYERDSFPYHRPLALLVRRSIFPVLLSCQVAPWSFTPRNIHSRLKPENSCH